MVKKLFGFFVAFSLASSSLTAASWTHVAGLTSTGSGIVLVGTALQNVYRKSTQKSLPNASHTVRIKNFFKSFSKATIAQTAGGISLIIAGLYCMRYNPHSKKRVFAEVKQRPVEHEAEAYERVQAHASLESKQANVTRHPVKKKIQAETKQCETNYEAEAYATVQAPNPLKVKQAKSLQKSQKPRSLFNIFESTLGKIQHLIKNNGKNPVQNNAHENESEWNNHISPRHANSINHVQKSDAVIPNPAPHAMPSEPDTDRRKQDTSNQSIEHSSHVATFTPQNMTDSFVNHLSARNKALIGNDAMSTSWLNNGTSQPSQGSQVDNIFQRLGNSAVVNPMTNEPNQL